MWSVLLCDTHLMVSRWLVLFNFYDLAAAILNVSEFTSALF